MDFFGKFWHFLEFFWKDWTKNRSKIGVPRTKTTSSSSKFCADSKTARLFDPRTVTRLENHDFLREDGRLGFVFQVDFLRHFLCHSKNSLAGYIQKNPLYFHHST